MADKFVVNSRHVRARLIELDSQSIAKSDRKLMNFVRIVEQAFSNNPKLEFFTYKVQKNSLFAVRWGLVGNFILIFRLKDDPLVCGTKKNFQIFVGKEYNNKVNQNEKHEMSAWARFHKAIRAVSEELDTDNSVLRGSLMKNLLEMTQVIPMLNFAKDLSLIELCSEIEQTCNQNLKIELKTLVKKIKKTMFD
jgi:hypothetical protein